MADLIERLRAFEGSDELGNGDFSLLREAAAALEAAREDACVMPWHRGVPIVRQSIAFDEETEHTPTTPVRPPRARGAGGRMTDKSRSGLGHVQTIMRNAAA